MVFCLMRLELKLTIEEKLEIYILELILVSPAIKDCSSHPVLSYTDRMNSIKTQEYILHVSKST